MASDDNLYQQTLKQYDDPAYAAQYAINIEDRIIDWIFAAFLSYLPAMASILDVASAAGRDANYLAKRAYKVTGVDLSGTLIDIAKKKYPGIEFIKADFTKMPFKNNSFDGIWCVAALVHLPSQKKVETALKEFRRVLKPGGYIVIRTKARLADEPETAIKNDILSGRDRYFRYQDKSEFITLCKRQGFKLIKSDLENEKGKSQYKSSRNENWLSIIAQKNVRRVTGLQPHLELQNKSD